MKLTKKQRLKVYRWCLEQYNEPYSSRFEKSDGVCHHLFAYLSLFYPDIKKFFGIDHNNMCKEIFPEFNAQRPDKIKPSGYWWNDRGSRIVALQDAIVLATRKTKSL